MRNLGYNALSDEKGIHQMKTETLSILEIDRNYDGDIVLVYQPDEIKHHREGIVVKNGANTDEVFETFLVELETKYNGQGFVYIAHLDRGDDLHVSFGNFK